MRPDNHLKEFFHLWFMSAKGIISRAYVMNIENLNSTLVSTDDKEVARFSTDFTPNYITKLLNERNK